MILQQRWEDMGKFVDLRQVPIHLNPSHSDSYCGRFHPVHSSVDGSLRCFRHDEMVRRRIRETLGDTLSMAGKKVHQCPPDIVSPNSPG